MKDTHLTEADLDQLVTEDGQNVLNRIFLHHLAVCPECHAVGGFILDAYLSGHLGFDFLGFPIDLARSRWNAPRLWKELEALELGQKKEMVRSEKRFWSWGLAEFLCRKSTEETANAPAAALEAAELAVAVAKRVEDWCGDDETWVDLLRAYAWAHLANVRRILRDRRGARKAFAKAEKLWKPAFADAGDVLGYKARFIALRDSSKKL